MYPGVLPFFHSTYCVPPRGGCIVRDMAITTVLHLPPGSPSLRLAFAGEHPDSLPVPNLDAALHHVRERGGGSVWLHHSAHPALGLPYDLEAAVGSLSPGTLAKEGSGYGPWPCASPVNPDSVGPWGVSHRRPKVDLAVPRWFRDKSLGELDASELLHTLYLYESGIGIPFRWTPGATGTRLMDAAHGKNHVDTACLNLPEPALNASTSVDMRHIRDLTEAERAGAVVVGIDQSSRYLASCSTVELGIGEPEWVTRPDELARLAGEGAPGYWYMPHDWTPDSFALWPYPAGEVWMTPEVSLFRTAQGLDFADVSGAWLWPEHSRYLRPYYTRLRSVLNTANADGNDALRRLVKRTYTESIGALAGHWRTGRHFRPDWRHSIVALSRVNTWRAMHKLIDVDWRLEPFAVDVDCFFIVLPAERADWVPDAHGWHVVSRVPLESVKDWTLAGLRQAQGVSV